MKNAKVAATDLLDFEESLSDLQREVIQSVRRFVTLEAQPKIQLSYRNEVFPKELIPAMGKLGLLGPNLSGYGLPGMDNTSYGLIMRELERCDSGLRSFASVQGGLVMYPIHTFGSEEQKSEWLPRLGSGEAVGCFGLTESEGGSDPSSMKTRAEKQKQKWILRGSKMWITNGNLADVAVVWAQTPEGIRGFLVPMDTPGVSASLMKGKLSLRASVTSELYFDEVVLPETALLPGTSGLKSALMCLNQARYGIAWGVLGAAEACLDEALKYGEGRRLFGKSLLEFQLVQRKLSLMASKIALAQLLALRLGVLKDSGRIQPHHINLGKQSNVECALEVARMARDILGANGIMDEYQSMRHANNLETVYTYEGTNDIHLLSLGRAITGYSAFA